ncbi:hypothetical protein DRJ17_05305 [Candidatus Woesearchaeota archaeon]|nr:MAG: hypothetical protein DRJ17_05305 [Candidatus Woesearchaeota archaeon]
MIYSPKQGIEAKLEPPSFYNNPRFHAINPTVSYSIALHKHIFSTPSYSIIDKETYTIDLDSLESKIDTIKGGYSSDQYGSNQSNDYSKIYEKLMNKTKKTPMFQPKLFLKPIRNKTPFIGKTKDIQHYILAAFKYTTGLDFPDDIDITICDASTMQKLHDCPGILGFCINRKGFGISDIFVLENNLDILLLTIGHEIGHALTSPRKSKQDEEAKAFAFSLAWINAIKKYNLANLGQNIEFEPAKNKLHDVAFRFVMETVAQKIDPMFLFTNLANGNVSINKALENNEFEFLRSRDVIKVKNFY